MPDEQGGNSLTTKSKWSQTSVLCERKKKKSSSYHQDMQVVFLLPDSAISFGERTVMCDHSWEMLVVTSGTSVDRAAPSAPMASSKLQKRRALRTCRFPELPGPCGNFLVFFILGSCLMHNQSPASSATLTAVKMMVVLGRRICKHHYCKGKAVLRGYIL